MFILVAFVVVFCGLALCQQPDMQGKVYAQGSASLPVMYQPEGYPVDVPSEKGTLLEETERAIGGKGSADGSVFSMDYGGHAAGYAQAGKLQLTNEYGTTSEIKGEAGAETGGRFGRIGIDVSGKIGGKFTKKKILI